MDILRRNDMNNAFCLRCNKPFRKNGAKHSYCGYWGDKSSCAYKRRLERRKKERNRRMKDPVYRAKMLKYSSEDRKKRGVNYYRKGYEKWYYGMGEFEKEMLLDRGRIRNKKWREQPGRKEKETIRKRDWVKKQKAL